MKILVLVDQLQRPGGLERSLACKLDYWSGAGHDIHLITIEGKGRSAYFPLPCTSTHVDLGINYERTVGLMHWKNVREACRHFVRLRRAIRSIDPDVVLHCGYGYDFYFAPLLKNRSAIVKENHSSRYGLNTGGGLARVSVWLKSTVRRCFEQLYDANVFLSLEEAELSRASHAWVIPNPIPVREGPAFIKERVVVAAGRICAVKGFDRLLEVWQRVIALEPEWRLQIYGDGDAPDVRVLHEWIADNALTDSVRIFPATSEIQRRMGESEVYALTSRSECFPMVMLEAMQLGVPIIAFDCPTGPRNILENGESGVLIPDGDIQAYASGLLMLMRSPALRSHLSKNAKAAVMQYEAGLVMTAWDRLLEEVVKR